MYATLDGAFKSHVQSHGKLKYSSSGVHWKLRLHWPGLRAYRPNVFAQSLGLCPKLPSALHLHQSWARANQVVCPQGAEESRTCAVELITNLPFLWTCCKGQLKAEIIKRLPFATYEEEWKGVVEVRAAITPGVAMEVLKQVSHNTQSRLAKPTRSDAKISETLLVASLVDSFVTRGCVSHSRSYTSKWTQPSTRFWCFLRELHSSD